VSSNHVKRLKGRSGIPVVEREVLKWSRVIKPPGKLSSCGMSKISTSGEFAVAITYEKGGNKYGELTLFNSDGEIAWSKRYDSAISNPQLSDDGNTIVVKLGINTLTAYDKRGKLLWTYSVEKEQAIRDYKLSRDGRYTVIAISEEGLISLKGHVILIRDGGVEWVKAGKGEASKIAISPNNAYIASASYDRDKGNTYVTLYTIDGVELWDTVLKGIPSRIDVSDNGEVLLSRSYFVGSNLFMKLYFIVEGRVLWAKADYSDAQFTKSGDRIIAVNYMHGDTSIYVFDRRGELLWNYRGTFYFVISDDYYVLSGDKGIVLVSAKGAVLQRIWFSELKEDTRIVDVKISPDGKYFAVKVRDSREGMCYLYFYENKDLLIRGIKEKLINEIDELIKR